MRLHTICHRLAAWLGATMLAAAGAAALPASVVYADTGSVIFNYRLQAAELEEKTNNLDEEPQLAGGEIRFLENRGSIAQQLSAVIRSSDGHVIVVDGGQEADAEHLVSVIREMGGTVDAWLITHPQTDHVGGLYAVLRDHPAGIDIRGIYYNFFDYSWYERVDPDECGMVSALLAQLENVPAELLHSEMQEGDTVDISEALSFRVLNSPVKSEGSFAVNSSGLMYDIRVGEKHLIILGDMGYTVGERFMLYGGLDGLQADYVQMSHHGQDGVGEAFYRRLNPVNCIWPTTDWLYHIENTETRFKTLMTRSWIAGMNVRHNYVTIGDDVIIR